MASTGKCDGFSHLQFLARNQRGSRPLIDGITTVYCSVCECYLSIDGAKANGRCKCCNCRLRQSARHKSQGTKEQLELVVKRY